MSNNWGDAVEEATGIMHDKRQVIQKEIKITIIRDHFIDVRNAMDEVLDTLRDEIRRLRNPL